MKKSECRKLKCHWFDGIACHLVSESYSGVEPEYVESGCVPETYNEYVERYQAIKERLLQLNTERSARIARSVAFEDFLNSLRSMENAPVEFDESMWRLLVEKVVVKKDGFLKFVFTNGMEVVI